MRGTRVRTWAELTATKGAYMKDDKGGWWAHCPTNNFIGNLASHDVVEHEDGTITVSPSILVSNGTGEQYHGYLRAGEWLDC